MQMGDNVSDLGSIPGSSSKHSVPDIWIIVWQNKIKKANAHFKNTQTHNLNVDMFLFFSASFYIKLTDEKHHQLDNSWTQQLNISFQTRIVSFQDSSMVKHYSSCSFRVEGEKKLTTWLHGEFSLRFKRGGGGHTKLADDNRNDLQNQTNKTIIFKSSSRIIRPPHTHTLFFLWERHDSDLLCAKDDSKK